jgi:tetratricopeptide (TPR) repeat protein
VDRHRDRNVAPQPTRLLGVALGLALALLGAGPVSAHESLQDSLARLTRRIEAEPGNAALYLQRGELHRVGGHWAAADADLRHARELDPRSAEVDFYRGRLLLETDRPAAAEAAFRRFLERQRHHVAARAMLADALARQGRPEEAAGEYAAAIRLQPRPSPELYLGRARALRQSGDAAGALHSLDAGVERLGPVATLHLQAIDLALQLGDFEAALAHLERLSGSATSQGPWLARRGEILERAGRPAEALRSYEEAIAALRALPPARRRAPATGRLEAGLLEATRRLARGRE